MKKINKLGIKLSQLFKTDTVFAYPERILFEPTNACNLECPLCPTGNGTLGRETGQMKLSQFKKIIDEVKGKTRFIRFSGYGEPIIAKAIGEMVKYASTAGLKTHLHSNILVLNSENKIQQLINSGLDDLTISIDGATQETYTQYRIGGNINSALEILRSFINKRNNLNRKTPRVRCQMVVTRHNEHEIETLKEIVTNIGVDSFFPKTLNLALTKTIGNNSVNIQDIDQFYPENTTFKRYNNRPERMKNGCTWLYKECFILWNGDVTTCCHDPSGANVMGNIFEEGSLMQVWNNHKYKNLRNVVNTDIYRADPLCSNCPDRVTV